MRKWRRCEGISVCVCVCVCQRERGGYWDWSNLPSAALTCTFSLLQSRSIYISDVEFRVSSSLTDTWQLEGHVTFDQHGRMSGPKSETNVSILKYIFEVFFYWCSAKNLDFVKREDQFTQIFGFYVPTNVKVIVLCCTNTLPSFQ